MSLTTILQVLIKQLSALYFCNCELLLWKRVYFVMHDWCFAAAEKRLCVCERTGASAVCLLECVMYIV